MYERVEPHEGRVVHTGKKLELRIARFEVGEALIDKEVVVHPGASIILPVLEDEKMVMIRNRRWAVGRELWELPAGTLGSGEDPEACAYRELREETGYQAVSMDFLGAFFAAPGWSTYRVFAFVGRDLSQGEQDTEDDESIQVAVVSFSEVYSMIARGDIVDAKTITVLALYAARYGTLEL